MKISPPRNWTIASLGEIVPKVPNAIVDGPFGSNLKTTDYVEQPGVPVLQGKNVTGDRFRWFDVRYVSESKAYELRRSSVRVNDILIVKIGSIGYSAVVDDLHGYDHAIIPANLAKVTLDESVANRTYVHHWLKSNEAKRYLEQSASKTAQQALSLSKIKALPVPLPPIEEQRRIAAILDQAEALRAKRRQALAKLDTLTQSLFLEMFGDPDSNPKGWTKKKLVDICSVITDGEHQTPKRSDSGFKLLSARNVRNGHLDFSDVDYVDEVEFERIVARCRPQRNDVLISCSGTIGRVSAIRTDEGLCLVRSAALLRPIKENVDTDFLEGWLLQPWMTRMMMSRANASGQPNLFQNQIKELPILVPSLSLQRQFSVRAGAIREQRIKFETAFDKGDKLASSLQHRAFRGEL